jgi:hypothetical protein
MRNIRYEICGEQLQRRCFRELEGKVRKVQPELLVELLHEE